MKHSLLAGLLAAVVSFIFTVQAQGQMRGRNIAPPFQVSDLSGQPLSASSYTASGTANEFVCSGATNICEVVSSINAATMTSTVPAFDIGPTATPDANDRLACFSYGASGAKTRVACVDTEGDMNATSLTLSAASTANAITLTEGARIVLDSANASTRYMRASSTQTDFVGYLVTATTGFSAANGQYQTSGQSTATLNGVVNDGATAVATALRSNGTYSTAGAKITSFRNGTTEVAFVDLNGLIRVNANNNAQPACDATTRGRVYYLNGGTGVADKYEICMKSAADAYAWKTIVTP